MLAGALAVTAVANLALAVIGIAGFGAIFGGVVVDRFAAWATGASVDADSAMAAARRLAAGDLPDALRTLPARMRGAATGRFRKRNTRETAPPGRR